MPGPWKPDGYSSVAPYLMVTSAQRVIDFLKRAFGATELALDLALERGKKQMEPVRRTPAAKTGPEEQAGLEPPRWLSPH